MAEIERRLEALANTSAGNNREFAAIIGAQHYELLNLAQFINTLEVEDLQKTEESIDDIEKFNEKIYEDGITWLFGHHCLECEHLTFAQHEVKELAKYFFELGLKSQKGE